ncbi:MAG TPA: glycogen synthase GlgA [Candidatus Hydrothermia bacterium]|nr:glycogen synthase GlgA [Candidatus Hydrothermae bacterium]MDD3649276.1 glycogen synthase GlgA [Candidatus Hydrothermia bacterium]MDD5573135.1 glycogen synthase GlgA [Candidatus Hydrothermia bacterium]HOP32473.1 glycogen synthase GlgA [Candidatus Hydrothermia bacterium]
MRVLFASSEIDPLAKTGGLADVASSLPKALHKEGIEVFLVMPYYKRFVSKSGFPIEKTDYSINLQLGKDLLQAPLHRTKLDGIDVYLVENDAFYDRESLYGTPEGDFKDNWKRFGLFSYTILELAKILGNIDIIHLNDWQTALAALLKIRKYQSMLRNTKTLISIHNLAYQGIFDKEILPELNLDYQDFHVEGVEYYGKVNFLKAGIVYSDFINTVSPTYAEEIQTPEFGYGLEGVLKKRRDVLFGILNGIDYDVWNPEKDTEIYANFGKVNLFEGKMKNKVSLLEEVGLKSAQKPLFGIVSRLAEQKGFDLFPQVIKEIAEKDLSMVVLGTGDKVYQDMFLNISKNFKNIYVKIGFDPIFAKRIYASSDFFLMPSKYEPCGLGQLIAMRYGTIPVVRATGGLKDTVKDIDEGGYGIVFEKYEPKELVSAIDRAITLYEDEQRLRKAVSTVYDLDFSWRNSAKEYIKLYKRMKNG